MTVMAEPVTFLERAEALVRTHEAGAIESGARTLLVKRDKVAADYPIMDEMRDRARAIRLHALANLDRLLAHFADRVEEAGGVVHFAGDETEAQEIVARILRETESRVVVKSKSMVSEEIELNEHLESDGVEVIETDLGEFIVQLAGDTPSHIIAPVLHMTRQDVGQLFEAKLGVPYTDDPTELNQIARTHLREKFLTADAGISGVNIAVAETGSVVLVTNEGNGRLTTTAHMICRVVS